MEAQTQGLIRLPGQDRLQTRLQLQVVFGAVDESALPFIGRLTAEAGMAVEHRQQRQADAGGNRGLADAQGKFGRVGVGRAVGVVMNVMEFGDRGVAGLEHLDVQLPGDDAELIGTDFTDESVHQVAPGPETVVGVAGHFRQPGHRPLESMGVQVWHAWQQRTRQPFGAVCVGTGLDMDQDAVGVDLKTYIIGPSIRQQRALSEEGGHGLNLGACNLYIHIQTFAWPVNSGKLATLFAEQGTAVPTPPAKPPLAAHMGDSPAPLYARVKQMITQQIDSGNWPPHYRVPSESELVSQLGFSRMTINRALREMTADGLLVRMQGVGTFVAEPKSQSALFEVHNIADEIASRGHRHSCKVITLEEEAAGSERALALDMREGQKVFHSLIVHFENDIPVQIEDRFVNALVAPEYLQQDFTVQTPTPT